MIELRLTETMMRAIDRFLRAADGDATLQKVQREGETILYFRKNGRLEDKLTRNILQGKPATGTRTPVLRLVKSADQETQGNLAGAQSRRERHLSQVESTVPGVLSSKAAQSLARRGGKSGK